MEAQEQKSVLFLSDIHLFDGDDPRQNQLVEFLEKSKDQFNTLVLVGDIFDFWIGYKYVVYSGYIPILSQFEKLVRSGKKLILFEGNHDFLFGPYFTDTLKVEVHSGPAALSLGENKVWVCHGDQLDPRDFVYKIFRWFLRSPLIKWSIRFSHPDLLWVIARFASKTSREKHKISEKRRSALYEYSRTKFNEGFNVVISGHMHDPFIKVISHDGLEKGVINIGDWLDHRSALWYKNGNFELIPDIERNVSQRFPLLV